MTTTKRIINGVELEIGPGVDLYGANLYGAELSWANLSRANLYGADLSGANLSWANLSWANLSGADLSSANLYGANLHDANLYGADLSGANLSWANLSWANLSSANLHDANLHDANLLSTDLFRARGIISFGPVGDDGRIGYVVANGKTGPMVKLGCFWGTLEEARKAIQKKYGENSTYEEMVCLSAKMTRLASSIQGQGDHTY